MPSEEEQIIQMIAQELMAGKSPDQVVAELMQAGVPRNDAYEIVNAVAKEIGRRGGGAPAPARKRGHPWIMVVLVIILLVLIWMLIKK